MSIKLKSVLLSVVAPVVLVLVLSMVLLYVQFQRGMEKEREILLAGARTIQSDIRLEVSESFEILRNVSVNPVTARVIERMRNAPSGLDNDDYERLPEFETVRQLLGRSVEDTRTDIAYIASAGSRGVLLGSDVQIGEGFDVRGRDYYQAAMASPGTTVISSPRVSAEESEEPIIVITAALSVENEAGTTVGIVAVNYRLNGIIDIIRSSMETYNVLIGLYDRDSANLLWNQNAEGSYFFDPDNVVPLTEWAVQLGIDEPDKAAVRLAENRETYLEGKTHIGPSLIQAVAVGDTRWSIAVIQARSKVVTDVLQSLLPPIIVFVTVFAVAQLFVFALNMRLMVRPMIRLGGQLEVLSRSDADLTARIPHRTNDEIGHVARSFNTFVEKLRHLMVEVKAVIERTQYVKSSIAENTEETTSAIEEIDANLKSIDGQLGHLDEEINENASAIEQITTNIASMDEQIISQSAMVEQSTSAINEMMASLNSVNNVAQTRRRTTEELAHVSSEGKTIIEETATNFKTVVHQIDQIQEMAAAINEIASQTNLLSMNAAIEAAHAGDSGRGFAVVAEEIRKLAESAGRSSQSISQLIIDITRAVKDTDDHVTRTTVAFERIGSEVQQTVEAFAEIEESVAELTVGGQQIMEASQQINEVTVHIKQGSAEIASGTEAMLKSAGKIREVSRHVSTGMNESSSGAEEIVQSMQTMVQLAHKLSDIVDQLTENFSRFKTDAEADNTNKQPAERSVFTRSTRNEDSRLSVTRSGDREPA